MRAYDKRTEGKREQMRHEAALKGHRKRKEKQDA